MLRRPVPLLVLLAIVTLLAGCGTSDASAEGGSGTLTVVDVTVDEPPTPDVAAIRLRVVNGTDTADTLESVTVDVAAGASVHESVTVDGVATMTPRPSVEIPAGSTVTFAPGGLHVMLDGVTRPLVEGDTFPVTFHFARAGAIDATATVVAFGSTATDDPEHDHD